MPPRFVILLIQFTGPFPVPAGKKINVKENHTSFLLAIIEVRKNLINTKYRSIEIQTLC